MYTKPVIACLAGAVIALAATTESAAQIRAGRTRSMLRSGGGSTRAASPRTVTPSRPITPSSSRAPSAVRSAPPAARAPSLPSPRGGSSRAFQIGNAPQRPARPSVSIRPPSPSTVTRVSRPRPVSPPQSAPTPQPAVRSKPTVRSVRRVTRPTFTTPSTVRQSVQRPAAVQQPSVGTSTRVLRTPSVPARKSGPTSRIVRQGPATLRSSWRGVRRPTRNETAQATETASPQPKQSIDAGTADVRLSSDSGTSRAEDIYPRRTVKDSVVTRTPEVTVIGDRQRRDRVSPRIEVGDRPRPEGVARSRRPPAILRDTNRPAGGDLPYADFDENASKRYRRHHRDMQRHRRDWISDLHDRHHNWWVSLGFSWGTPYVWEPYWYPRHPYIGRWAGYRGWYHCTPYTTGIWWPWHRRVLLGYAYTPSLSYAPYSTSVWIGYDPFLYFWWPAPYNVSVNYYTYEYGNYPPESDRAWSRDDWVYYQPSQELPPEVETPLYSDVRVPEQVYVEEPVQVPVYIEPEPSVPAPEPDQIEPAPAGVVEAAAIDEEAPVEVEPATPPEPYLEPPAIQPAAKPPIRRSISSPAPGKSAGAQTLLATGGIAFLGAALWMAWPKG